MSEGIKETMEAMDAAMEMTVFLVKRMKDGVGLDDAMALFTKLQTDAEFMAIMKKGVDNISKVPKEVSDIGMIEASQLTMKMVGYTPRIIGALRG